MIITTRVEADMTDSQPKTLRPSRINELSFAVIFVIFVSLTIWAYLTSPEKSVSLFLNNLVIAGGLGGVIWLWAHLFLRSMRVELFSEYIRFEPITLTSCIRKSFPYEEITAAGIEGASFVIARNNVPHHAVSPTTNKHPDYMFIPIGNCSMKDHDVLYQVLEEKGIMHTGIR